MHNAKHRITLRNRVNNYSHGEKVIYLIKHFILIVHLAEYTVNMLRASFNMAVYAHFLHLVIDNGAHVLNICVSLGLLLCKSVRNLVICHAVKVFK